MGSELLVTLQSVDTKRGLILLGIHADSTILPQTFDAGASSIQNRGDLHDQDGATSGGTSDGEDLSETQGDMPLVVEACKKLAAQPGVVEAKPGKRILVCARDL